MVPSLTFADSQTRNVMKFTEIGRKIVGIGLNYKDHVKEMGHAALPKNPVIFLKPTSAYVLQPNPILLPPNANVHHEVELGVVIGKTGRDIRQKDAMDFVAGYTLALDMTARTFQAEAKKAGLPWTVAKGFDTFCPVGMFINKSVVPNPHDLNIWCRVDGKICQSGSTRDMIFPVPRLIEAISAVMTLEPGDLILTGTPAGVGPVRPGQTITCGMTFPTDEDDKLLAELNFTTAERE